MPYKQEIFNAIRNDSLTLGIMPTERCNFRCVYCYEDFSKGNMSREVIDGIKKLIKFRMVELNHLEIGWFGGEPLLAKEIIFELLNFIFDNKRDTMLFVSSITSNGYNLDKNTFETLFKLGVKNFSVSLDGIAQFHNNTRRHINKNIKTYDRIISNLRMIKSSDKGVKVFLRVHHTPSSMSYIKEFSYMLNEEFFCDDRFIPIVEAIRDLGGEKTEYKYPSYAEADHDTNIVYSLLGREPRSVDKHICYAAKPNHFLIRSDGSVSRCTVALDDPKNSIGKLNGDGSLTIDNLKSGLWTREIFSGYTKFNQCPKRMLTQKSSAHLIHELRRI